MLYATKTGTAPAAVILVVAASTSLWISVFQSPNQIACGCAAILSSSAASAGRVDRHAFAVARASDDGSTYRVAPARTLADPALVGAVLVSIGTAAPCVAPDGVAGAVVESEQAVAAAMTTEHGNRTRVVRRDSERFRNI
jgi:hypothetical protein